MGNILGNTKGIRDSVLAELEKVYDLQVEQGHIISQEMALKLIDITDFIGREISVFLARNGQVLSISIGDNATVELPPLEGRRSMERLSGIRCIHTHPNGNSALSGLDISALKRNKYDLMVAIGVNAEDFPNSTVSFGLITDIDNNEQYVSEEYGPIALADIEDVFFPNLINTVEKHLQKKVSTSGLSEVPETAILVAMEYGRNTGAWSSEDSIEELKQLADTAGAIVKEKFIQKRPKPDPAFFIGKGKAQELALYVQENNIDLCIFDDELSPAQGRNLEQILGIRVLDRTALILDIFAQRARTNEGKLQVELAQLQYNLPRIMGKGLSLSRLGGGIGTRGPGETKLEVDRRRIRDRIAYIKDCISKVNSVRELHREKRNKSQVPNISLVGYTNAGKSTLLNTLTQSDIYAKDQLFATLDPTTRQLELPDKRAAVLTDTVGFIQRLPHQLVAAFKSTLEVVCDADLLLHVIDVSHVLYKEQSDAVYKVLEDIGAKDKEILTVYNKIDKLPVESGLLGRLEQEDNAVCISAKEGIGSEELLAAIVDHLKLLTIEETFLFPYDQSGKIAQLHNIGTVLEQNYEEAGTVVKVRLDANEVKNFEEYIYKGDE